MKAALALLCLAALASTASSGGGKRRQEEGESGGGGGGENEVEWREEVEDTAEGGVGSARNGLHFQNRRVRTRTLRIRGPSSKEQKRRRKRRRRKTDRGGHRRQRKFRVNDLSRKQLRRRQHQHRRQHAQEGGGDVEAPRVAAVTSQHRRQQKKRRRPNIVLVMSDDQDVELGSLQFMPKLNRYLREEGAHFENGFVTTPMCCPSRSSMLTGLYAHNHNVLTNNDNCSSTEWVRRHEPRTFAAYLSEAGYKTGYFGKYLNKYNGHRVPAGWHEWMGLVRNSRFYNYTVNRNGEREKHGDDYATDYFPDMITNSSLAFLRRAKQSEPDRPLLAVLSYPGPHGPEDAAPQHQGLFFNVTTHHTPAYDYAPNPDKQWILQVTGRMTPTHRQFTDLLMTRRLQTLQSIDDGIEKLYRELESLGELDNTYIIYTSDHGYHLGQFGLVKGKAFPFDMDIKVPFFVRGPGMGSPEEGGGGQVRPEPALNIDIAPTILDMAGVERPKHMDGKSLLEIFKKDQRTRWRDSFLVERGKMTPHRFEKLLHLHPTNPNEIPRFGDDGSLIRNPAAGANSSSIAEEEDMADAAAEILSKKRLTKQERLAVECLKPRYRSPCNAPFQKLRCVRRKDGSGGWRLRRCDRDQSQRRPREEGVCHCQPGAEFGWRMQLGTAASEVARAEMRLQRDFLKKHTSAGKKKEKKGGKGSRGGGGGGGRHKFLKSLSNFRSSKLLGGSRFKREVSDNSTEAVTVTDITNEEEDPAADVVLDDLAREEIAEVDVIMEDISDEIRDLQDAMNGSAPSSFHPPDLKCRLTEADEVDCSSDIYSSRADWRHSRSFVNEQIRRLRAQLYELKEIRKHLREKRPNSASSSPSSRREEGGREEESPPSNAVQCRCQGGEEDDDRDEEAVPSTASKKANRGGGNARRPSRRERLRLQRARRRVRRRERRRQQRERLRRLRKASRRNRARSCNATASDDENLNCFSHDNAHWKTAPFWTGGSFCACTNSNSNTYWCVRTVNVTHNYLYCEFVSGIITYYDLNVDPYQLRNIYQTLSDDELNYMHGKLLALKVYSGSNDESGGGKKKRRKNSGGGAQNSRRKANQQSRNFIERYGQYLPPIEAYRTPRGALWGSASSRRN